MLAAGGAALAAALAVRLAMEERSRRESRRRAGSWSPPPRTTCAPRSPRCGCWSSRSTTASRRGRPATATCGEIRTHVAVLSDLIDDLFELSRIEAGDISWTLRQVELGELIDDTVAAMRAPAEERGVVVAAELPGEVLAGPTPRRSSGSSST